MNDKLYIIGNGFDLHHNMKTSYKDFRDDFAMKKHYLLETLSSLYGAQVGQDLWWCDFEEMLARIDYNSLMNSHNGLALGPVKTGTFLTNNLPVFFGEWIASVDDNVEPDLELNIDRDSQFFTFNYTMLLEKAYGVNKDHVWHIHNSILDHREGRKLIVGHDSDDRQVFSDMLGYDGREPISRKDIADEVNREIVKGAKEVNHRIASKDEVFHRRYSTIRHYISMGFSYNAIDMPYIKKIISVNDSFADADWLLYSHSEQETKKLNGIMKSLGVDLDMVKTVDW